MYLGAFTSIGVALLLICILIALICMRNWSKENNQPTIREQFKENIKEAKRIWKEN